METAVSLLIYICPRVITDANVRRIASRSQSLKKFEVIGGLVSGTEESRGKISLDRPNRQWDFP